MFQKTFVDQFVLVSGIYNMDIPDLPAGSLIALIIS